MSLGLRTIGLMLAALVLGGAATFDPPDVAACKKNKDGTPDERFVKRHESFVAEAKKGGVDLLLMGDFLTDDFRGNAKNGVKAIFDKAFGPYHPANFGQGGDYVQHVLWRLQNGELEGIKPKVMMLMIGGTNGSNGDPPDKIAAGIAAIIATVKDKSPTTKILLLPVLPRAEKTGSLRARHTSVNALLPKLDDGKTVKFVDIVPKFVDADGTISKEVMPDFVHLSDKGYQIWADAVEAPLKEMMAE